MPDSVLNCISFANLDIAQKNAVRRFYLTSLHAEQMPEWDYQALFNNRGLIEHSLALYRHKMERLNPHAFTFLDTHQRLALVDQLLHTFYLLSAQYALNEIEHRRQAQKNLAEELVACSQLIEALRQSAQKTSPESNHTLHQQQSEKHLKYLGLTVVAPFISEKIQEFNSGKTQAIKNWMGQVNGKRLYWVWGGGLLSSVISLLPDTFSHKQDAQFAVSSPSIVTGYMSWILYYARFGMNLCLLLKHTIAGPWMSQKEREIPAWDRFKTQWSARKFSLLNDSIWATANMVCFFWLTGSGLLGYVGNALTAGLLLMDVSLNIWAFYEASTEHNKKTLRLQQEIDALAEKIKQENNTEAQDILKKHRNALLQALQAHEFEWKYKKYGLINDLVYATGLLAAFSVLCCFFLPPSVLLATTATLLGIVGSVLCFTMTIAYAAVTGGLEIKKSLEIKKNNQEEQQALFKLFNNSHDEQLKKQIYLDILQLQTSTVHQDRMIHFQKLTLVRSILVDALVPPLIFISFVFLPMGVGIAVLAAGLAMALISHLILNKFKPEPDQKPEFNDDTYRLFKQKSPPPLPLRPETNPSKPDAIDVSTALVNASS